MLADRYAVADVDSHIIEPADLWTSRMASKWGDLVPHVAVDERINEECWFVGDRRVSPVGSFAIAGWPEYPPSHPPTFAHMLDSTYLAKERLAYLDETGIYYQLLYPNILGFFSHVFLRHDLAFATESVQAYNDFLTDFCSADASRLIPLTVLPFWDLEASIREVERTAEMGHRGVIFSAEIDKVGEPPIHDPHWKPLLECLQSNGQSVNFHFGFSASKEETKEMMKTETSEMVKFVSLALLGNARSIAEVVLSGLCHQYPELHFVSVENGAGWLPYFAEAMDWQWANSRERTLHPERLLPSDYMKRQLHFMYWFEKKSLRAAIEDFEDNLMFETDFPHPTSLSPGPVSASPDPRIVVEESLGGLPEETAAKILQHNATKLYRLEAPKRALATT